MEKLTGYTPLYDLCGEIVTTTDRQNVFENVELFNSGEKQLTPQEYELLGSIAYFHGLQFTSQRVNFNKKTMENFQMRMKNFEIDLDFQEKVRNFIESVNVGVIVEGNEKMKQLIVSPIQIDSKKIQEEFEGIVRNSIFDISLSEQVYELINKDELTYSDILLINKLIFENLDFNSQAFTFIENLNNIEYFNSELAIASKHFDSSKFSMVYLDSILTLKEWFEEFPLLSDTYIDIVVDEIVEVDPTAQRNFVEVEPKEETKIPNTQSVDVNETDLFLRSVLVEASNTDELNSIENADDLMRIFGEILDNDDLLPNVYKLMRAKIGDNRKSFESIYGFPMDEFKEKINTHYVDMRKTYKGIVEEFLMEISPENTNEIIELVDKTISTIIIEGKENKAYLMQQLSVNQIKTINHLHQMLGLIESCRIIGSDYESYVALIDYVSTKTPKIQEIFNKIENSDKIQMDLNYYKAIIDFYDKAV